MKKVKCSFCGKDINCPEKMSNARGHMCTKCFDRLEEGMIILLK